MDFTQEQVTENEIVGISYHYSLRKLAVCSRVKIRLYLRGKSIFFCWFTSEPLLLDETWRHERRLSEPCFHGKQNHSIQIQIVSIAWLPHSENELLVAYEYHGVL